MIAPSSATRSGPPGFLHAAPAHQRSARWRPRSVALILLAWLVLHVGGLFSPGLLDDVDSVYIEIAREMLRRHDFVTPYIDGIRFFDKPPLMYWLAAGSMHLFGVTDWAARLPLALLTLALFLSTYALGLRLFAAISPPRSPDRGALYAALALATSIGPYLYTRFFIPDIVVTLWLTLSIHLFLIATERAAALRAQTKTVISTETHTQRTTLISTETHTQRTTVLSTGAKRSGETPVFLQTAEKLPRATGPLSPSRSAAEEPATTPSPLLPMLGFAGACALSLLTKGFIGLLFPLGFAVFYLALTRQIPLLRRLSLLPATAFFLAVALPWHILVALRNPAIPLPPGLGLPARGGWAWFYLYNEHIARFLSRRIPHDYGQVPIPLFWLLAFLWLLPWAAFLPSAIARRVRELRANSAVISPRCHEAALALSLWALLVLGFFTLSARQEYYSLPALPALALLAAGLLARADRTETPEDLAARHSALLWSRWFLLPLFSLLALASAAFALTSHPTPAGTDLATLLSHSQDSYNLSLSHIFDLTGAAMGLFRGPLLLVAFSCLTLGPVAYLVRHRGLTFAANLTLAGGATILLLAVHTGLVGFYPILGSKRLAEAVLLHQQLHPAPRANPDLLLIDGELTAGSTLLFYTGEPVHLVDGRVNGPWYGSFWPDSPAIFETETSLHQLWPGPRRLFLLTYHPDERTRDLARLGPVFTLATSGGKAILTNRP